MPGGGSAPGGDVVPGRPPADRAVHGNGGPSDWVVTGAERLDTRGLSDPDCYVVDVAESWAGATNGPVPLQQVGCPISLTAG